MNGRIESLQVLRLLAAAMVALLHITQAGRALDGVPLYCPILSEIGSFGVDVFFVLSGFIIARTAADKTPGEFLRLRLTRVVPIYWLMTAAFLPFLVQSGKFTWTPLVSTLAFYPEHSLPYLHVGWTLCFEMLFYFATALTLYRPRLFAPLALAAFAVCWILREQVGGPFRFFGNPLILEFLTGVLIARTNYRSKLVGAAAAAAAVASLTIVALRGIGAVNDLPFLLSGELALQRVVLMGAPAACLVFAALQIEVKRGQLSYLGDASYSLYLVHPVVIAAMVLLVPTLPGYLFTPLVFALSVGASLAVYAHLERPLIAAFRRRWPLLKPVAMPA
jgi:exopolysaccharide production protein ExoZ